MICCMNVICMRYYIPYLTLLDLCFMQWCSGAERMRTTFPHKKIEWERRSYKRKFERYLFIIPIK